MELSISQSWMSQREPHQPLRDDERIARAVALTITGDQAAFGEIVLRYERRVLTLSSAGSIRALREFDVA